APTGSVYDRVSKLVCRLSGRHCQASFTTWLLNTRIYYTIARK
ncbi:hypothetical protein TGAM01_v208162, partial [Trichoderma gamsii]